MKKAEHVKNKLCSRPIIFTKSNAMKAKMLSILIVNGLIFCSTVQFAQSIDFGLTAGVSTGSVKISEIGNSITNTIHGDGILGFEGGIFTRLNFDPLSVKGMLLYAWRKGSSEFTNGDGTVKSSELSVGKIELPVLFGLRLIGPVRFELGPVVNWIVHENHLADETFNLRKTGYGYRIGAAVELGQLSLGLSYQGLKNKSDGTNTATYASPDELIFSLSLLLSRSNH